MQSLYEWAAGNLESGDLEAAFNEVDADGSGEMEYEEFRLMLSRVAPISREPSTAAHTRVHTILTLSSTLVRRDALLSSHSSTVSGFVCGKPCEPTAPRDGLDPRTLSNFLGDGVIPADVVALRTPCP